MQVYLDNNATTRVALEVLEAMLPFFSNCYGNPSSMHSFGGQVGRAVTEAREQVAELLGAEPEEIVFTSCGTESDSTAIFSALQAFPEKRHIVTTRVEHPAVKNLCESLTHLTGHTHRVTRLMVEADGTLDLEAYKEALTEDTAIVSVMWANNETGVLFPVEEMAALAKERGILFHTDAVQAVGKIPVNLQENQIDVLSLSGHKLHAPKGVGVLYVRKGTPFVPFLHGGHQEFQVAGPVHFLPDDALDLLQHAPTERSPGVNASGELADHAGAHHQLVAGDFGIGGGFFGGVERELGDFHARMFLMDLSAEL